jgi:hypothetical protein
VVVAGDEQHHRRRLLAGQHLAEVEAGFIGQLDIQQHGIGLQPLDRVEPAAAPSASPTTLKPRREQLAQLL